ncbi:O-antigen ligase family protein [Blastococcus sp. CCUG 61487]|uniref:O-antigen ligase family protein n=1 Tax=Blastococcus sp. CCUG 61487 TaxID=1840703 RepID=UPI0010C1574C|nr:O-antigen ligase family protein [Blastococcus sp. CCUG 61487]TKJ28108.1 hypothetical protein A6V29_03095 [Blastococcus sp. CCUG 61487]
MHTLVTVAGRPSTWVAVALLATPLAPASASGDVAVTPSDAALVIAVVLAGRDVLHGRGTAMVRSVPAVAFWVLGAATSVVALVAVNQPEGLVGGLRFLQLFCLVPIAVMVALRSRADAVVVLGSFVGLAVVEGTIGILQSATGTGADIGGRQIRAVGTFGAYNIGALASLSALGLLICLALAVVLTGRARWLAAGTAAYLVLPLVLSLSRGTWVAVAIAAVVVLSHGRPLRLLGAVGAAALVAAAVLPVLLSREGDVAARITSLLDAGSTPDQSVVDRLALWSAARDMAFDHPWTGVGARAFAAHRDAYADLSLLGSSDIAIGSDFQRVGLESPHNLYLLVAGEQGLVTAGLFVVAFLLLVTRGLVRSARPRSDLTAALALAGTGMLVFQLVLMLSGDLGGPGSIFVAVTLGLAGWSAADRDLAPVDGVPR